MSPTILKRGKYRFFFFSRGEPRKHTHVIKEQFHRVVNVQPVSREKRHLKL